MVVQGQGPMEKRGVISSEDTPPVYADQLRVVKAAHDSGQAASPADLDRLSDSLVDRVVNMAKPKPPRR